jgi:hypothetical protein
MKLKYPVLAASVLGMAAANAATISWSSAAATTSGAYGQVLNTGLFTTIGTQILAENVGGAAQSFDGINFTAGTITFAGGTYGGFHEGGKVSQTGTYGTNVASTVNLTGLTTGYTYRVQALVYDGRSEVSGRTVNFDGINQGVYANGVYNVTWGNGLLVTGTFVADAATQNFTIEAFSGATSKGGQLNALALFQTAVPEPSAALLGGLGMLALLRRRR